MLLFDFNVEKSLYILLCKINFYFVKSNFKVCINALFVFFLLTFKDKACNKTVFYNY